MEDPIGLHRALGSHRGVMLALEAFARAVAATHERPTELLAMFERCLAVVDANSMHLPLPDAALYEARRSMTETANVFIRELRRGD